MTSVSWLVQLVCHTRIYPTNTTTYPMLQCHFLLLQGNAASVLVSDVLQLVLRGAHDSIPNVRFTAVRALQEMAPHLDAGAVDSQVGRNYSSNILMGVVHETTIQRASETQTRNHSFAMGSYVCELGVPRN